MADQTGKGDGQPDGGGNQFDLNPALLTTEQERGQ